MRGKHIPVVIRDGVEGKECSYCQKWHPISEYHINKRKIWECRHQRKIWSERYVSTKLNADEDSFRKRKREIMQAWRSKNKRIDVKQFKMDAMLHSAKVRAKRNGLDFTLTEDAFSNWRHILCCPVFPWLTLRWDNPKQEADSPSIDRIDPNGGYVIGNVRIISWRANCLKRDATEDELIALIDDYRKE